MLTVTQSFSFTTYNKKLYAFSTKIVTKNALSIIEYTSDLNWHFKFQTRL